MPITSSVPTRSRLLAMALAAGAVALLGADQAPQALPFAQSWTNIGLISATDDWTGVPGIEGYRGDDLVTATGVDPQTILADGTNTPLDVNANQTNPNTFATGGVAEFHIADPVIALNGSGTADAPFVLLSFTTSGQSGVQVAYVLRDLDGSIDDAVMPVALQYRIGGSGDFTNLPAGFVADATTGPSVATLVTPVSVALPAAADNQPLVQVRVITTNAVGNDEWVGQLGPAGLRGRVGAELRAGRGRHPVRKHLTRLGARRRIERAAAGRAQSLRPRPSLRHQDDMRGPGR